MASAKYKNTVCGYCMDPFSQMIDPRELPCSHVFCEICLQEEYKSKKGITCRTCRQEHKSIDVDLLPLAEEVETTEEGYTCDVCKKSAVTGYCSQCDKLGCSTDLKSHEDLCHKIIAIDLYRENPALYKKVLCEEHQKEMINVCDKCLLLACEQCDMDKVCLSRPWSLDDDERKHISVPSAEKEIKFREEYNEQMYLCTDKITKIHKLDKDTWRQFEEYISTWIPSETAEKADRDLEKMSEDQRTQLTDNVHGFTIKLMERKDLIEEAQRDIQGILDKEQTTEMIREKRKSLDSLKSVRDGADLMMEKREKKQDVLEHTFRKIMRQLKPVKIPKSINYTSIKHVQTHSTPRYCYSVSFKSDGRIIAACDFGFDVCGDDNSRVYRMFAKYPTTAIELNGTIYYINLWNYAKVNKCSLDLEDEEVVFTFRSQSATHHPRLAVSERYLAVTESGYSSIKVYNMATKGCMDNALGYSPTHAYFHPDGELLVTGTAEGMLVKYGITSSNTLREKWRRNGISNPCSVCTDSRGYIFVACNESRMIRVISAAGNFVSTLLDRELPTNPGGMSIQDDVLAIACRGDGYKFFNFG